MPPGKRIERICQQCGCKFSAWRDVVNQGQGRFCSQPCFSIWRRKDVTLICQQCGISFHSTKAHAENRKFCSPKCQYKGLQDTCKAERQPPVERICQQCTKHFTISASRARQGKGQFCSKDCQFEAQRTAIPLTCVQCGKIFTRTPFRVNRSERAFCSKLCNGKAYKGEGGPNYRHGLTRTLIYRRTINGKRRAAKQAIGGHYTAQDIQALYKKQHGKCYWCLRSLKPKYHIDHRVALSKGGDNSIRNIVLACPNCNCRKNNMDPYVWARQEGYLIL